MSKALPLLLVRAALAAALAAPATAQRNNLLASTQSPSSLELPNQAGPRS